MAREMKSVVKLADGAQLAVQQDPDSIRNLIEGCTTPHVPLITLTDVAGQEHAVNANHIVSYTAAPNA